MKVRVTKKQIMENYPNVIWVGYCDLQFLLSNQSPRYYTANCYGWRADIYEIDPSTVIVTGYGPFGNVHPDYELTEAYERKARKVCVGDWRKRGRALNTLLKNYVRKALNDK